MGYGLKFGGLVGEEYKEVTYTDENGEKKTKKVPVNDNVEGNAVPFLDPRRFKRGTKVELAFNFAVLTNRDNKFTFYRDKEGKGYETEAHKGKSRKDGVKASTVDDYLDVLYDEHKDEINQSKEEFKNDFLNKMGRLEAISNKRRNGENITEKESEFLETIEENFPLWNDVMKSIPVGMVNKGHVDGLKDGEIIPYGLSGYYWFNNNNVDLRMNPDTKEVFHDKRDSMIENGRKENIIERNNILFQMKKGNVGHKTTVKSHSTSHIKYKKNKDEFQSIKNALSTKDTEFDDNAILVIYRDGGGLIDINQEMDKTPSRIKVRKNGKLIKPSQIENLDDIDGSKVTNGQLMVLYKSGVDENGSDVYSLGYTVTNFGADNESNYQETLKRRRRFALELQKRAKEDSELRDKLDEVLGYDITEESDYDIKKILSVLAKYDTGKGDYRIMSVLEDLDYFSDKRKNDKARYLPNVLEYLTKGKTVEAALDNFVNDIKEGTGNTTLLGKDYVANSVHTPVVFTPMTKNGKTVFTKYSQPKIIFNSSEGSNKEITDINSRTKKIDKQIKTFEKRSSRSNPEVGGRIKYLEDEKEKLEKRKKELELLKKNSKRTEEETKKAKEKFEKKKTKKEIKSKYSKKYFPKQEDVARIDPFYLDH